MSVAQASVRKAGGSIDPKCERAHSLVVRLTSSRVLRCRTSAGERGEPALALLDPVGEPRPDQQPHEALHLACGDVRVELVAVDRGAVAPQQCIAIRAPARAAQARSQATGPAPVSSKSVQR